MLKKYYLFSIFYALILTAGTSQNTFVPTKIINGEFRGVSKPLSSYQKVSIDKNVLETIKEIPNNLRNAPKSNPNALPSGKDPLVDSNLAIRTPSEVLQSFEGFNISESGGFRPPDPTGAVGPNHYVHAVNSAVKVFNKNGITLLGPTRLSTFFQNANDDGDPIVLYDQLADRWFISQFINGGTVGLDIAVSTTPDPTGSYNRYRFELDDFPDYPHYTVWPDGYYLTANKSEGNTTYVLDRDALLSGGADPTIIGFNLPGIIRNPNTVFSPEPANLLGTNFPAGVPGYIVYLQDDAWSGVSFDHLKIWEITVDFSNPSSSTISDPQIIATTPFDSTFSPFGEGDAFQPGASQKLDNIGGVISYMANYRSFGDHNSFLLNFNTDIDGFDTSGIRWIELRNTANGPFEIYQEGTWSVPDGDSRFLGSMAMDAAGNIALAYNVSGFGTAAAIRYTGRMDGDPLGRMSFEEAVIQEGIGIQEASNRFGDYAQMTLDPDGETFWHVAEYFTSLDFWATRIASFNLDNLVLEVSDTSLDTNALTVVPVTENLYEILLDLPNDIQNVNFEIYDIKGSKTVNGVLKRESNVFKATINTGTYAAGIYAVRVQADNISISKKFLVK